MEVVVIGTGYVGLVSGTCFADFGFSVTCVDKDVSKIENLKKGIIPIYEPGLEVLVQKNTEKGHLKFTTDLPTAVKKADVVFIAVGTPSRRGDGHADLSYVFAASEEIAASLEGYTVVTTKSTVPVGTGRKVLEILNAHCPNKNATFDVVSNPEFLREGSAIEDFMRPDRVVLGAESDRPKPIMEKLYNPLYLLNTPIVWTNLETSELIKYAANGFLATKIAFINEIADLCEKCGANVQDVSKGIGLDGRIGKKFLHAGPGYGGSCFPKDTIALARTAQEFDRPLSIIESVISSNDHRKKAMAHRVMEACGGDLAGKTIGVLGVTFKPNTDDMREAPSLEILPMLQALGATIQAYDPVNPHEALSLLPDVQWMHDAYSALKGADACLLLTEWNEFRALDLEKMKSVLKSPIMVDLRNVYDPTEMEQAGFTYSSIGRG
jgi:UDPglucose 6-dehydrogenase